MTNPTERIAAITERQRQRRGKKPRAKARRTRKKRELVMVVELEPGTRDAMPYILHAISMVRGVKSVDIQRRPSASPSRRARARTSPTASNATR